jgi:hypothetical protein
MTIILATHEAKIRRIAVRNQPRQMVHKTLSWKYPTQKRAGGVAQGVDPEFKPQYHKHKIKNKQKKCLLLTVVPLPPPPAPWVNSSKSLCSWNRPYGLSHRTPKWTQVHFALVCFFFCPGWPPIWILLILASQVGGIIGMYHWHLTLVCFINLFLYANTSMSWLLRVYSYLWDHLVLFSHFVLLQLW